MILPAITLAIPTGALIAQVLAKSLHRTLREPYIDTARAKGASRRRVHLRHAVRNASLPALTMAGIIVGNLLSGAVVIETVFSRSGLGRVTSAAVADQDIRVVQGLVLFGAAGVRHRQPCRRPALPDPRPAHRAQPAPHPTGGVAGMTQVDIAHTLEQLEPDRPASAASAKHVDLPVSRRSRSWRVPSAARIVRYPGLLLCVGWVALVVVAAFAPEVITSARAVGDRDAGQAAGAVVEPSVRHRPARPRPVRPHRARQRPHLAHGVAGGCRRPRRRRVDRPGRRVRPRLARRRPDALCRRHPVDPEPAARRWP